VFSLFPAEVDDDPIASTADAEPGFDDPVDLGFIPAELRDTFEVHSWRNAATILSQRHSTAFREICTVLAGFRLQRSHLVKSGDSGEDVAAGGGRKSLVAAALDGALTALGWNEAFFETEVVVSAQRATTRNKIGKRGQSIKATERVWETFDAVRFHAPTHKVDCYKNRVALEVEWNNKNPFFDRDLNNFRLLFDLRVVEVGVIITRCDELDALFDELLGKAKARERYGATTTHMGKLTPLVKGGGGGGCPVLIFGISRSSYDPAS
jgi:hypothetical protein